MAEEVMRLNAEVVDKFSKPLKDLRDRLGDVKPTGSMKDLPTHFNAIERSVLKASSSITGGLTQAMSGLGLASLSATASVAGVVAAVRGFSTSTIEMKNFERATGVTIATLKAFKHAASSVGVDEGEIGPALRKMSDNLREVQHHRGSLYDSMLNQDPQLLRQLVGKNADQALRIIEEQMANMSDTLEHRQQARHLAEAWFGNGNMAEFAARGLGPLNDLMRKFYKEGGPSARDEQNAVAFAQSMELLQEDFKKLRNVVGTEVTPALAAVMGSIDHFIEANKGKIGTSIKDAFEGVAGALGDLNWKSLRSDVEGVAGAIKEIAEGVLTITGQADKSGQKSTVRQFDDALKKLPHVPSPMELWHYFSGGTSDKSPYGGLDTSLFKKSSYGGGAGGLLHNMAFTGGGAAGGPVDALAEGVKRGMLAAIRELNGETIDDKSGGGAGGVMNASFGGGGGFGSGGGAAAVRNAVRGIGGPVDARGAMSVAKSLPPEARALLDTLASGEAKGYNVINGGARFGDYSRHPFEGLSTNRGGRAAGRYQDLPSTWARIARATGLKDFSPESQDKGNWWLAQSDYRARTHRDLLADLKNPAMRAQVGAALSSTWVSLNRSFGAKYRAYLERVQREHGDPADLDKHDGKGPRPMPKIFPLPGERERRPREPASATIRFENMPAPVKGIMTNGGDHFDKLHIDVGRPRMRDA